MSKQSTGREQTAPRSTGVRGSITAALAVSAAMLAAAPGARADSDELQTLRQQVQELSRRLDALTNHSASPAPAGTPPPAAAGAAAPSATPSATLQAGPLNITLGGFVELLAVNRSRNEASDWASNYNSAIPFPQSPNYNLSEFHLTERQSRVSALVQGPASAQVGVESYLEADFGAAPSNGNNNESTGFSPRVRQFYADYQRKDDGWYLLFGQAYSMITQDRLGIRPRTENVPIRADGQDLPGFLWTRVPQLRFVKQFGDSVALGLSLENPAMLLSASTTAPTSYLTANNYAPVYSSAGASGAYASGVSITADQMPDILAKVAFDPGWGHYEIFGMSRTFRDRNPELTGTNVPTPSNSTTTATSGGANVLLPLIPNTLEISGDFLAGKGVGRYGSGQLPDATLAADGSVAALSGYLYFGGLVWTPVPELRFYAYGGREHVDQSDWSVTVPGSKGKTTTYGFGYGSPLFSNANCLVEGSSGNCAANTATVSQATIGGWWRFYQGALGNMQVGLQLTNVKREAYAGVGPLAGGLAGPLASPSTNINIGLLSFRYYPFQP